MAEHTEEDYEQSQDRTSTNPPKGSEEWAEQNSGQQGQTALVGRRVPIPGLHLPAPPTSINPTTLYSPEQQRQRQQYADAVAGYDRQIRSLDEWLEAEGNRPETPEERRVRERKEKSKRVVAAVSDGLSALSNLFFTTQYAPSMYNHDKGSMKTVDAHLEKLKAERERKREQYLDYSLKRGHLENQRAATVRELEAQQEQLKIARERAAREAEQHGWAAALQDDRKREQTARADKAEQDAITARAKAEGAPAMVQAELETERAHKGSYDAAAQSSAARAEYYRNGGSAGMKKHHFRGKEYISDKDYAKDVEEAARQYNERHMEWTDVDDGNGGKMKKKVYKKDFEPILSVDKYGRKRPPAEFAGEVETRLAEEENENTPPSRREKNDDTPPSRR